MPKERRTCVVCGKVFDAYVYPYRPTEACSRVCKGRLHSQRFSGANSPAFLGGRKTLASGYVLSYAPNHPRAQHGYVFEHILVAERALGHYLPEGAVVHHRDEIKSHNENTNLVICQDNAYHNLIHGRMRMLEDRRLGGKVCGDCKARKPFTAFAVARSKPDGLQWRCRDCLSRCRQKVSA